MPKGVIAGLDPATLRRMEPDAQVKPGHDDAKKCIGA
jgi:hypothetical protein